MKLKIYSISDSYIKYIRQFDRKIYDNKVGQRLHTRKYVGIVLTINNMNYYVPMSSPKKTDYLDVECKKIRPSVNTIIRMNTRNKKGELILRGTLRISNMIPVPIEEIDPYNPSKEEDVLYKDIIEDEIAFIRKNENKIISKAKLVYKQKSLGLDIPYLNNCINYKYLEEKCVEYNRVQEILPNLKYINNEDELFYIYDTLDNKELFEKYAKKLDKEENINEIRNIDINNLDLNEDESDEEGNEDLVDEDVDDVEIENTELLDEETNVDEYESLGSEEIDEEYEEDEDDEDDYEI